MANLTTPVRARLGDTIEFSYKNYIHDPNPQIFFLAKVGKLVHGMNQHYQSPQEKSYFFYALKSLYWNKIRTGQLTAYDFYHKWVKNRLHTDSYRTYRIEKMVNVKVRQYLSATQVSRRVDWELAGRPYPAFKKGDKVRYVSMVKNKLAWQEGVVLGRGGPPGFRLAIRTKAGEIVQRHPADLKKL